MGQFKYQLVGKCTCESKICTNQKNKIQCINKEGMNEPYRAANIKIRTKKKQSQKIPQSG